jgi:hypothetical protein
VHPEGFEDPSSSLFEHPLVAELRSRIAQA